MPPTEYRPCVVAVFTNSKGMVLLGKRADVANAWQFPQGGIEPGEGALTALYREMAEELGCDQFKVILTAKDDVKYQFPQGLNTKISSKWLGQSQKWFLTKFDDGFGPNIEKADTEFAEFGWFMPNEAIEGIVQWKRNAYEHGLRQLGLY